MTSIAHRNAQPYMSADQSFSFAHNGYFKQHDQYRSGFADRLEGTSDSEVGFHYWQTLMESGQDPGEALVRTHAVLGGDANLGVLQKGGKLFFYAGNRDNAAYTFEMDRLSFASTALHSDDNFLFQTIFPRAVRIKSIPFQTVKVLNWLVSFEKISNEFTIRAVKKFQ